MMPTLFIVSIVIFVRIIWEETKINIKKLAWVEVKFRIVKFTIEQKPVQPSMKNNELKVL